MDNQTMFLAYTLERKSEEFEKVPRWARAEGLTYYDLTRKVSLKNERKHAVSNYLKQMAAELLRGAADKLDPVHMAGKQAHI